MGDALAVEEQRSILSTQSVLPSPVRHYQQRVLLSSTALSADFLELVKRIRALTIRLLPVEVELTDITDATSSIITPEVIRSFALCGGDFGEAVPFCLLRAKALFVKEGYQNPADYDECCCRATACEVLARRIVHNLPADRLESVMSTRFRYRDSDGDVSAATSLLETAIDQHCTIFLASTEAQYVVNCLWRGDWVQQNNENDDIDYVRYEPVERTTVWQHLNPQRMNVPRYQTAFRQVMWIVFLFVYSQSVQSPLDSLDPEHEFDEWEYVLYTMTLAYLIEEGVKVVKTIKLAPRPLATIGFWTVINFITDGLLLSAFALRIAGLSMEDNKSEKAQQLHFKSFQVLSCVAPLIWIKLLTVFDGFKVVGTLQVVTFRMLRESAIFFILLALMGCGFLQSMYALDAADGESGGGAIVINSLIQALLGAPDFETPNERFGWPFGLIVYYEYTWNFLSTIILVNVLIALFGSAYSDVEENATDEYLAFFAQKTISLIRAPDSFVYPAPFNLLEVIFVAPLEYLLPSSSYFALNKIIMSIVFFPVLILVALFESQIAHSKSHRLRDYFSGPPPDEEGDPKIEDPTCEEEGEISRLTFEQLTEKFPSTAVTEGAVLLRELRVLREKVEGLERDMEGKKEIGKGDDE
ncbi:calcium activated cation channel [Tremella mesenterica]|uniref:Calcium activated cation channel n=1 Tax=Tremella mesenterica TaxID=5217 RepID=A0A4Q1BTH1_TREME|nr:calcium activated cation channel [Tremella mesenterica]